MTTTSYWKAITFILSISLASFVNAEGPIGGPDNEYVLTWDPVPTATGYKVYLNGEYVADSSNTDHRFQGMAVGQYSFTVSAVNEAGEGPQSDPFPFQVIALPPAPTGLQLEVH